MRALSYTTTPNSYLAFHYIYYLICTYVLRETVIIPTL